MATNKQVAEQLVAEADRKTFPGFFNKMASAFGMNNQTRSMEDAVDLYLRAADIYRMEKEWSEAGKVFNKTANLHKELGNKHDAATSYTDASNCYKNCDSQEAVNCLLRAIGIYTEMGRFAVAARYHMMVAEIYEGEESESEAVEHYSKATDYYQCDEFCEIKEKLN